MHNAALISSSQEFEVDQWYKTAAGRTSPDEALLMLK